VRGRHVSIGRAVALRADGWRTATAALVRRWAHAVQAEALGDVHDELKGEVLKGWHFALLIDG
jgi:hypothetical protein